MTVHDKGNLEGDPAAQTVVDPQGSWHVFYDPRFYLEQRPGSSGPPRRSRWWPGPSTGTETEAARSQPKPNPEGRVRIDLTLRSDVVPPPSASDRLVRGWIEDGSGRPLPDYGIEVYDRDIGPLTPEQRLGADKTRKTGAFTIRYKVEKVAPGDAPPPVADLVFRIVDPLGRPAKGPVVLRQPVEGDASITWNSPCPRRSCRTAFRHAPTNGSGSCSRRPRRRRVPRSSRC